MLITVPPFLTFTMKVLKRAMIDNGCFQRQRVLWIDEKLKSGICSLI